jgi:hypothetical protein
MAGLSRWKWQIATATVKAFEYEPEGEGGTRDIVVTFYYDVDGQIFGGRDRITAEAAAQYPGVSQFLEKQKSWQRSGDPGLEDKVFIVRDMEIPIVIRFNPQEPEMAVIDSYFFFGFELVLIGVLLAFLGASNLLGLSWR